MPEIYVLKLGGSLLDLNDLVHRLQACLRSLGPAPALLVVGGGPGADLVRSFDRRFGLDEHDGHWLAVRAMQFNAHLLASVLPGSRLVSGPDHARAAWAQECLAVMDPIPWLEAEEALGVRVPHQWQFTSDSIAAHLAHRLGAARLILLKSTRPDRPCTLDQAADLGLVDTAFPRAAADLPPVELINLRDPRQPRCTLAPPA